MSWHQPPRDDAWKRVTLARVAGLGQQIWLRCNAGTSSTSTRWRSPRSMTLTRPRAGFRLHRIEQRLKPLASYRLTKAVKRLAAFLRGDVESFDASALLIEVIAQQEVGLWMRDAGFPSSRSP